MTIVIDIEEKVNSEITSGHISLEKVTAKLEECNITMSKLCKLYVVDSDADAHTLACEGRFILPLITEKNASCDFSSFKYLITDYENIDDDFYVKIWQRYMGLPWHILETDRCIVREMTADDVKPLYELYSDSSITRYTEPLFPDYEDELEYTHNYIHNIYEYFGFGTWIVERKSDRKIIGRAGFNYRPDYDIPEIGYVFGTDYQNNGYALEVCKAIIKYAYSELEFDSIMAFSSPENKPSLKLLTKLGFINDSSIPIPNDAKKLGFELVPYRLDR